MQQDEAAHNGRIPANTAACFGIKKHIIPGAKNSWLEDKSANQHKGHAGQYTNTEDIGTQAIKISNQPVP